MKAPVARSMASAFCYAVLTLINRRLSAQYGGIVTAFYEQLTAAIVLLPAVLLAGIRPSRSDIFLLLILGIFTTALAHAMFIQSLRGISARLAGICSSMETVYGIILSCLVLGEAPTVWECVGGIVILGTVIFSIVRTEGQ